MKKVSIAMATFNGDRFIKQQLESIVSQTYQDIEINISDDASQDNTLDIIREYQNTYQNIRLLENDENCGFKANFEKAIAMCSGDFIALADQDDIWKANKIETLVKNIGEAPLIYSGIELVDQNGVVIDAAFSDVSNVKHIKKNQFQSLLFNNFVTGCTMMFRADLKEHILPFCQHFSYHDWWIAFVASNFGGIVYIPDKLVQYRQHDSNHTGAIMKEEQEYIIGWNSCACSSERDYIKMNLEIVNNLIHAYPFFSKKNKTFLKGIYNYYQNFCESKVHLISFWFGIKYFRVLHSKKNIVKQIFNDLFKQI